MVSVTDFTAAKTAVVNMGQVAKGRDDDALCAVLGSCIAATLYDPGAKIGTMAHVVLPESSGRQGPPGKFADAVIPHMVDLLTRSGARRDRLVAKIAGGASMFGDSSRMQIGAANMAAVSVSLDALGIPLVAQHTGGQKGRRVTMRLADGSLQVEVIGAPTVTI